MIRFLADENFNNAILRGLRLRLPDLDIVRAQDVGLTGWDDPDLLDWAAREGRAIRPWTRSGQGRKNSLAAAT